MSDAPTGDDTAEDADSLKQKADYDYIIRQYENEFAAWQDKSRQIIRRYLEALKDHCLADWSKRRGRILRAEKMIVALTTDTLEAWQACLQELLPTTPGSGVFSDTREVVEKHIARKLAEKDTKA